MRNLNYCFTLLACLTLASCGYESTENNAIGQVKRVTNQTPLLCNNWKAVDISLGVIQNGTGSMSTQDEWFYVESDAAIAGLEWAAKNGTLVDLTYDVRRVAFCTSDHWLTSFKYVQKT